MPLSADAVQNVKKILDASASEGPSGAPGLVCMCLLSSLSASSFPTLGRNTYSNHFEIFAETITFSSIRIFSFRFA